MLNGGLLKIATTVSLKFLIGQENASIGRKIGLTERIVSVLPDMKCPSSLEPHQVSI